MTGGALEQPTITNSAFTLTLDKNSHGASIVNCTGTYCVVTLPASSGDGSRFRVRVGTTATSSFVIQVANATDVMQGTLIIATDIAGVTINTTATSDTITMSGSTTGGVAGSFVELIDVASGFWQVSGGLISTGSEATPFSAAVS